MKEIIKRLSKIEHGFQYIEIEAKNIFHLKTTKDILDIADKLLENDIYQARMLAVFLFGYSASKDSSSLKTLKTRISKDINWRVQEILAKSFDYFCNEIGYEKSLPIIKDWLNDPNPNVCRAVTEGLRIWTNRPYFKTNPQIAIQLISQHKASESEYLRKSVGNSLRDILKKHKNLVEKEISTWDLSDKRINFTYKYVTKSKDNK
jgi:3-methyladenine DNA glycosylase AlkD